MVPRGAIVAIDATATRDDLFRLLDTTDEERFPVRRSEEEILGYVTMRDIARLLSGRVDGTLDSLVRPVHIVPESALALEVLEQLQTRRVAMALVVDEAGGIEGLVEIDGLAEELVGSLQVGAAREDTAIDREPGGEIVVPASLRVHVANRLLELDLPTSRRWSTVGGLLLSQLGAMPTVGAKVHLANGLELEVVDAGARRIHRVRIRHTHDHHSREGLRP
jgi:CBS domain containing-hemolysin-like protein